MTVPAPPPRSSSRGRLWGSPSRRRGPPPIATSGRRRLLLHRRRWPSPSSLSLPPYSPFPLVPCLLFPSLTCAMPDSVEPQVRHRPNLRCRLDLWLHLLRRCFARPAPLRHRGRDGPVLPPLRRAVRLRSVSRELAGSGSLASAAAPGGPAWPPLAPHVNPAALFTGSQVPLLEP
jgi:hypothetical protein